MTSFKFSSLWASFCATILGLLGFGCSNEDEPPEGMLCMYGTPTATFEIKGRVLTEKGSIGVPDAVIKVMDIPQPNPYFPDEELPAAHTYFRTVTSEFGFYSATGSLYPTNRVKVACVPLESKFQPDTVIIELEYVKTDNNDSWDEGTAKAEVNFKLKEKPTEQ
ncbi:MAG: radical SAM-associated putative lipoprotein [Muribaculaceae bacterium]|nr:radical SAM-associated putative lipoprotein [Muribaculaceae bacterium]